MLFEPIDVEHLPNTSNIDGVPIYANPIKLMRRLFLQRLNLCLNLMDREAGHVLDVGCGSGILLPTLSKINGIVVGLDLHNSLSKVHHYLKRNKFTTISLVQASSEHLPFKKETFDSLLCVSSLDHLIDPRMTIDELHRVSVLKGNLISGIHCANPFYYILSIFFILFYIVSYFIVFRNYLEFISANREMASWKHMYTVKELMNLISIAFKVTEIKYLGGKWPVYVAFKSAKERE